MMIDKKNERLFAICVNNTGYPASLELHKIYPVLPDEEAAEDGDLRVVDESGEDYLHPAANFLILQLPPEMAQRLSESFAHTARVPNP